MKRISICEMNMRFCRVAVMIIAVASLVAVSGCGGGGGAGPGKPGMSATQNGDAATPTEEYVPSWKWSNPKPQGNDLNGVDFVDNEIGYAVGAAGTIIKTNDGGDTWVFQDSGTKKDLLSVECPVDESTCYITGKGGIILKTTKGGSTWEQQNSGKNYILPDISCVDQSTCIAVGDYGTIIKTTNGGESWISLDSGVTDALKGVDCPSAQTCYVADMYTKVLKTTNGGDAWIELYLGERDPYSWLNRDPWFYSIECYDINNCYVGLFGQYRLAETNDGGLTWGAYYGSTALPVVSISCPPSENRCFYIEGASYAPGEIYRTFGGAHSLYTAGLNSITCPVDSKTCYAVGNFGAIIKTTDAGSTWNWLSGEVNTFKASTCLDKKTCYAVGSNETIVRSTDGGMNWTKKVSLGEYTKSFNTIMCIDANKCYAAGNNKGVVKTEDGWDSWTKMNTGTDESIRQLVCFEGTELCYAITRKEFLKTENGGGSWTVSDLGIASSLKTLTCPVNKNVCYLSAGAFGAIYKTTDGGGAWNIQNTGISEMIVSITCPKNDDVCYAISSYGKILKTTSGGDEWILLESLHVGDSTLNKCATAPTITDVCLESIACPETADTCYVGGSAIYKTADGGKTWDVQEIEYRGNVFSISCVNNNNCIAVGSRGEILTLQ